MNVGTDDVVPTAALVAGGAVIAMAVNDAAEGLNPVCEMGSSTVVLITHHRHVEKLGLNHDVANKTRGSPVRVHVDK